MSGSLYERLTLGAQAEEMDEDESIRANLSRIFGTRQGAVQIQPMYGLPDINDLTLSRSELQSMLCSAIVRNIIHFEPRLRNPRVTGLPLSEDAPFTLRFVIHAEKAGRNGKLEPWSWTIPLDQGKFRKGS